MQKNTKTTAISSSRLSTSENANRYPGKKAQRGDVKERKSSSR